MESAPHHLRRTSEVPRLFLTELTASLGLSLGNTPTRAERRRAPCREQGAKHNRDRLRLTARSRMLNAV